MTLLELMRAPYLHQCRKHGLGPDPEQYATEQIDQLSNSELLSELSEVLEAWKAEQLKAIATARAPQPQPQPQQGPAQVARADASPGLDM